MPSQRRQRALVLIAVLTVVVVVYMTSGAGQTRNSPFYTKTQAALREVQAQDQQRAEAVKQRDAESVRARLKASEEVAKKAADEKGQRYVDSVEGGGSSSERGVAGRVKLNADDGERKAQGVATLGGTPRDIHAAKQENETPEDHDVEVELNAILKRSPIIIFSKTYCPFSRKAKHILLDLYNIVPAPYVVELDQHPLGGKLQSTLAERTHRSTVPNILVQAKSIGGGDDIARLHETGELESTLKSLAGPRLTEVSPRPHD